MENLENNDKSSQMKFSAIIFFWVMILFLTGKNNQFVEWDDQVYIYQNDLILNPTFTNLGVLLKTVISWNFHPLTMFSLWLNAFIFGNNPASFIIVNALFHAINSILVYKIANKFTSNQWVCFFVALFWGVHPMHVESVTWIAERKDVLYAFFFFLSILSYIKYLNQNQRKYLIMSILWFICSCLSKGMAVVLPLILLLIDYWFDRKVFSLKNLNINKLAFWVIALIIGLITMDVQRGGNLNGILNNPFTNSAISAVQSTWSERFVFAGYGMATYLFKLFIPIDLRHVYPIPEDRFSMQMIGTLIISSAFIIYGIYTIRKQKVIAFGILFFLICIALVSQILPVGEVILAERYTYIAYFGLLFSIFLLLERFIEKNSIKIFLIFVAFVFSFITFKQIKTWKNTISLWENAFQKQPDNTRIALNLIKKYQKADNTEKVIETAKKVIEIGLKNAKLYQIVADNQIKTGDFNNALPNLQLVEKYATPQDSLDFKLLYLNKAMAYDNLGKKDSAIFYMGKAQQLMINK